MVNLTCNDVQCLINHDLASHKQKILINQCEQQSMLIDWDYSFCEMLVKIFFSLSAH